MEPINREQRRHPEVMDETAASNPVQSPDEEMRGNDRTQDDLSVRAKSTGHGKKTADKWNQ